MRIRTVKPEFWSHPVIGRLPGETQAIAIGLLNMADDEGFLLADPVAIKSALRPFDDSSTIVRRCVDELSRAGWIVVRTHHSHGPIGCIPNFAAHQRIDRPKTSKLKKYYDVAIDDESTTNRRCVDDKTAEEGNREQGTGNGTGNGKEPREQVAHVVGVVEKPEGDPDTWDSGMFFRWAQFKRQEVGLIPEKRRPATLGSWYSSTLLVLGGEVRSLMKAFHVFAEDPHWQKSTPALPFAAFVSQWDKYARKEAHALASV